MWGLRMKVAILANESRKNKDNPIIKEAEQAFDEVIYAPIKKVRFDLVSKGLSNGISLEFEGFNLADADCVLVIPTNNYKELFYTALRMLDGCITSFDHKTYMLTINEDMLLNFLNSNDIIVRKSLVVSSNISIDKISERIKLPAIVCPPTKRVVVTNKQTLKDVLSLYKYGTPIRIETPIKSEKNVWLFILEDEVIACYEKMKNVDKVTAVDDDLKKLAIKIRNLVNCEYCAMHFLKRGGKTKSEWVFDRLTFSPDFSNFQKITGVNIGRYVISHFSERVKKIEKGGWQKKLENIFRFWK